MVLTSFSKFFCRLKVNHAQLPKELCAWDGTTFESHCELFLFCCDIGVIHVGDEFDINQADLVHITEDYIDHMGHCAVGERQHIII